MTSPMPVAGTRQPESVVASLAAWDDDRLCSLLRRRPDLATPPPRTLAALAERAVHQDSAVAAYEGLDRSAQQVAEVLALLPAPATVSDLARLVAPGVAPAHLDRALGVLEDLALAFRHGDRVTPNPGLAGIGSRTGLGPPIAALLGTRRATELADICRRLGLKGGREKATSLRSIAAHLAVPANVADLLAKAPPAAAELAERAAGPWAYVEGRGYGFDDRTPAGWLANRALLASADWYRLVMPGEVGLALRGGHVFEEFWPDEPGLRAGAVDAGAVDAAGAEAALAVVADVAAIVECWDAEPPTLLKDGGVGVRDVRRAARATDRDEREVARLLDIAAAAGLAGADHRAGLALPGAAFDEWAGLAAPARWARLVGGWLGADLDPSVAGALDTRQKRIPPLLPRRDATAADRRRRVLAALAAAAPGQAPDPAAVSARARWASPALWDEGPARPATLAGWVLEEAALLGLVARGSLTAAGRAAVAGDLAAAAEALAERAPALVDRFVLQADLTAVAPGALRPPVAAELELLADVESRGAATVYRLSERSVRRAFDAGRSAAEIVAFLEAHAAHGVPQALAYLVADVGRRHGRLRVGAARCYVRTDDTALTAEVGQARALARLGLRALGPGVLVGDGEPATVVDALRAAGYLPVTEDTSGAIVITRPPLRRAPPRPAPPARRPAGGGRGAGDVAAIVGSMRQPKAAAAVAARAPARRPAPPTIPLFDDVPARPVDIARSRQDVDRLVEDAVECDWALRISYVNGKGRESQLDVVPVLATSQKIHVSVLPSFASRTLTRHRVQWARVLTEAEEDQVL